MKRSPILFLVEVALFSALGAVLSLPYLSIPLWLQGGSISFAMVPILFMAFRWGLKGGLLSGLLIGLFNSILDPFIVHPAQYVLDYPVAFFVVGFAGIFSSAVKHAATNGNVKRFTMYLTLGAFVGCTLRFLSHFASGIIFIDYFMPEGVPGSVWMYSLTYNIGYMLPSFIISAIVLSILLYKQPRFLHVESKHANRTVHSN